MVFELLGDTPLNFQYMSESSTTHAMPTTHRGTSVFFFGPALL